mgnify:FL=1
MSEIFNDYILREFPVIASSASSFTDSSVTAVSNPLTNSQAENSTSSSVIANIKRSGSASTGMIVNTVSMKPSVANQDIYRKVVILYKDKSQEFTFHLLSNGPPTILEILNTCKDLFKITHSAHLQLYHNLENSDQSVFIKDDMELASIFNQFTLTKTFIEIKEYVPPVMVAGDSAGMMSNIQHTTAMLPNSHTSSGSTSPVAVLNGLRILSNAATAVPSASSALQNQQMKRTETLSSPPPDIRKCSGLFSSKNLPKPLSG